LPVKCFKVVKKVLDDTYDEIGGSEQDRDAAIRAAIEGLSTKYRTVLTAGGPDFSHPVSRFAYVYTYVPAHAHWVHELISWSPEAAAVFDLDKVRIACIGGGPGSDLVGILKFLDERAGAVPKKIFCEIVDGCEQWKHTWADIGFVLDLPGSLNTDYVIHRVGQPDLWSRPHQFAKADILTLSFFVSEIAHLGNAAWEYLEQLLGIAKPGALLLFNDNNDSRFYEPFDALAAKVGWDILVSSRGARRVYDSAERLDDLATFGEKFGYKSRLTGDMAWRVLRKRAI